MSTNWQPIADLPEKPEGDVVLSNGRDVMGLYSGVKRDQHGTTWFIDDALYDGDNDPLYFLVLPPIPERSTSPAVSFRCPTHGLIDHALFDGYNFGDTLLEGLLFQVRAREDRSYEVNVAPNGESYFRYLNEELWLKRAKKYVATTDFGRCSNPGCHEDVALQPWNEE